LFFPPSELFEMKIRNAMFALPVAALMFTGCGGEAPAPAKTDSTTAPVATTADTGKKGAPSKRGPKDIQSKANLGPLGVSDK
jgi:hypothetical protein